jgi:predicted unusual protein kinase regulating ubiquinone biosynthesis (AarF/ABC1/UbiB family)
VEDKSVAGEPEEKKIPQGRLARVTKIAALQAGLATELFTVAGRVMLGGGKDKAARRFHQQTAQKLLKTFGQMKGLPMKIGQMVSYLDDYIPQEHRAVYRETLGALQTRARPIRWKEMEAVIRRDFGKKVEELFLDFNNEPIAAASIGQVYRATLKGGQAVAVKVQYPGIAEAIQSDLKNIQTLKTALSMILSRVDIDKTLTEISDRMLEECDYGCELCSHEEFWSAWKDDPDVVVPKIYHELSSEHVITMDYIEGRSIKDIIANCDQETRNKYGRTLFRFVFKSLYAYGLVNADPHPGNYLFLADGRIAFIDYGCVQRYDDETVGDFREVRERVCHGKRGLELKDAMSKAYGFPDDLDDEEFRFLEEFMLHCFVPLTAEQPYQLTRAYTEKLSDLGLKGTFIGVRKAIRKGVRELKGQGLVFLSRIHSGLMGMLANLQAEADWKSLMAEIDADIASQASDPGASQT